MHTESGAAPGLGLPGALGEQKRWRTRSGAAGACANESIERARLADLAGLPAAQTKVEALMQKVLVLGIILLILTFLSACHCNWKSKENCHGDMK